MEFASAFCAVWQARARVLAWRNRRMYRRGIGRAVQLRQAAMFRPGRCESGSNWLPWNSTS
jgi:hypothetical protein